jgi:hypothetical protein
VGREREREREREHESALLENSLHGTCHAAVCSHRGDVEELRTFLPWVAVEIWY